MLVTGSDPRAVWRSLCTRPTLTPDEAAQLRALPAGAKEAPIDWVCTTRVERRGHFDKDEQGEVFSDHTIVTGWRAEPDPGIHRAGALSFSGLELLANGLLFTVPPLGDAISALTLDGNQLQPTALEAMGRARAWVDLAIWGARWSPAARKAGLRELAAAFPHLRGLELQSADLDADDLATLSRSVERLEDLTLTGRMLDEPAACALIQRLGPLAHLDLRDARLGPAAIARLAPKLTRARRINLSSNPIGDEGLHGLLRHGALDQVEDLWLSGCGLTDDGMRALAGAAAPKLRGLWLDSNQVTDDGVEALIKSPLFAQLEGLSLYQRGVTERTTGLLAGHPLAGARTGTARLPGITALWFLGR